MLVAKAQKVPEEGWIMQDGTPWPGNNTRDHPGMIQVYTPFTFIKNCCQFLSRSMETFEIVNKA